MNESLRDGISIGGFAIATTLAGLRVIEFFRDRKPRLTSLVTLRNEEEGNTITLLNASKIPANIHYFDLAWVKPGSLGKICSPCRKIVREDSPLDGEGTNMTVEPFSQRDLHFAEQYYFGWGARLKEDVYLRLWIIGRKRPLWFFVTGPR